MVLKYVLSKAPARLENMVVKIYEASNSNPGAEVYTEVVLERDAGGTPTPGGGHNVIWTVTANGLDTVVHVVRLYGETSGQLIHEYNAEPRVDIVTIFDPIQFKIGDGDPLTPADQTSSYTNPALVGLLGTDILVHRNNYGFLFEGVHYTFDTNSGTITLIAPDVFAGPPSQDYGEEITIMRKPTTVSTVVNDSVVGKWFAGYVDVNANLNYANSHLRKLIRFGGGYEYTFELTSQVPLNYAFCFQHFGSAGTAKVNFNNGTLLWGGAPKASIDIPRYTEACFVWDGTNWNVVYMNDTSFANGSGGGYQPMSVVDAGNLMVGDVAAGDPQYEIIHNKNIPGDYLVMISIKSNNISQPYWKNNKLGSTWYHHATDKPNRFWVSLQELAGEAQDISISWLIIKL